jgi:hypothetical protein
VVEAGPFVSTEATEAWLLPLPVVVVVVSLPVVVVVSLPVVDVVDPWSPVPVVEVVEP